MFKDVDFVVEWDENPAPISVGGIYGEQRLCSKTATVQFLNVATGETETLYHVVIDPHAKDNIISEGQWAKDERGYWFLTTGTVRMFGKPGRDPQSVFKVDNHAVLHIQPVRKQEATSNHPSEQVVVTLQPNTDEEPDKLVLMNTGKLHYRTQLGLTVMNTSKEKFPGTKITGKIDLGNACALAKALELELSVKATESLKMEIVRNPADWTNQLGKIVLVDLEFYDVNTINTKTTVNFTLTGQTEPFSYWISDLAIGDEEGEWSNKLTDFPLTIAERLTSCTLAALARLTSYMVAQEASLRSMKKCK
jgi:hypothetical protein